MDVNKMAGLFLIVMAVVNVLHEIAIRHRDAATPGVAYAFVTAMLVTLGAVLIIRKPIPNPRRKSDS
jgi:hypothetical protein